MTATLSAGSKFKRPASGFSLLELLLVLTIAALALSVTVPRLNQSLELMQFKRSVRGVMAAAKLAREHAMTGQQEVRLVVDLAARTFRVAERSTQDFSPSAAALKMTVSDAERNDSEAAIRFYPDGSATGGRIEMRLRQHQAVLDVDWITGISQLLPAGV